MVAMTFDDAMAKMKLGHVAKRDSWSGPGYVRIYGTTMLRVRPGVTPAYYKASSEDKAATDWQCNE
jgi:hypothetical protein